VRTFPSGLTSFQHTIRGANCTVAQLLRVSGLRSSSSASSAAHFGRWSFMVFV